MLTKKQIEERKGYIGGSDCAGVLGLSRWSSPLKVWAEKTGQIEPDDLSDNISVRIGNKMENAVCEMFTEDTGLKLRRNNQTIFHPEYPFIAVNVDRMIVGQDEGFEAKTASAFKEEEWKGDEIPQEYILQCLHSLAVTGKKRWHIACTIGNHAFAKRVVERDEDLIRQIIQKEVAFWKEFVEPRVMPMTITANDAEVLSKLFPNALPESIMPIDDDLQKFIESRTALMQDKFSLEKQLDKVDNEIRARLQEKEMAESDLYKVTWKNQRIPPFLDTARMKEDGIYSKYELQNNGRVLRVKAKKEKANGKTK